ncbi:MAG: AAA family ATPase [Bacteroidales bacterium]|nr:AAA family ATPase [Bacteroidales bacterium]
MDELYKKHDVMLRGTSLKIVRDYMHNINWKAPMLCLRGARGVGKSTLLRQYAKTNFPAGSEEVLYCSVDGMYFSTHSILDVAEKFNQRGGQLLILDEVHKYNGWSREVKEVADLYPDMRVMLSGSSMLTLTDGDVDLSRRCVWHDVPGLSFREYLQFYKGIELPVITFDELLADSKRAAAMVNEACRPLQHFHDYLRYGYYPYYLKNKVDYYTIVEQTLNYAIEVELPVLRGVDPANSRKLKALVSVLAHLVPFEVDVSKLSATIGVTRGTVIEYLRYLADAGILSLLYSDLLSVKKMQKPDKIYLDNPNLLYAIAGGGVNIGTARECFVVNQLKYKHKVEYGRTSGDFMVDGQWTFEVGGEGKDYSQIADLPDSFILADDIEMPHGNKIPLWLVGFLY